MYYSYNFIYLIAIKKNTHNNRAIKTLGFSARNQRFDSIWINDWDVNKMCAVTYPHYQKNKKSFKKSLKIVLSWDFFVSLII